ncbi:MAG: CarD family transcriptional regulator [Bacteroidota bacterium]|jgi:CarD family transcriptional regulator
MPKKKALGKPSAKSVPAKRAAPKRVQQRPPAKAAVSAKARKPNPVKPAKAVSKPSSTKPVGAVAKKAPEAVVPAAAAASKQPAVKTAAPKTMAPPAAASKAAPVAAASRPAPVARAMPAAVSKPGAPKLTAPITPKQVAEKAAVRQQQLAAAATSQANKKPVSQRHGFKTNEFIVYPAHGVGRIVGIEEQEIAGISLELFVIQFEKDKMTLRVPTGKSQSVGMRKLSEDGVVKKAMETLKGKARIKRTMWSRRAQEYEAKINSGDLISIAEVVRDLYRSETQPEQSYSERQLYEAALDRMAREIAAVDKLDERGAMQRITEVLSKSAKGRRMAEEPAGQAEVKAA